MISPNTMLLGDREVEMDEELPPVPKAPERPTPVEMMVPLVKNTIHVEQKKGAFLAINPRQGTLMESPEALQEYFTELFSSVTIQEITSIRQAENIFTLRIDYTDYSCGTHTLKAVPSQLNISIPGGSLTTLRKFLTAFLHSRPDWAKRLTPAQKKGLHHLSNTYTEHVHQLRAAAKDLTPPRTPLEVLKSLPQKFAQNIKNTITPVTKQDTLSEQVDVEPEVIPNSPIEEKTEELSGDTLPTVTQEEITKKDEMPLEQATVSDAIKDLETATFQLHDAFESTAEFSTAGLSGWVKALVMQIGQMAKTYFVHKKTDKETINETKRTLLVKMLPWVKGSREAILRNPQVRNILNNTAKIVKKAAAKGQEAEGEWKSTRAARESFFAFVENLFKPKLKRVPVPQFDAAAPEVLQAQREALQQKIAEEEKARVPKVTAADIMDAPGSFIERASDKLEDMVSNVRGVFRNKWRQLTTPQPVQQRPHSHGYKAQRA